MHVLEYMYMRVCEFASVHVRVPVQLLERKKKPEEKVDGTEED